MPIPSPEPYIPSNLTKQQRQEQLAVLYGGTVSQEFTEVEYESMRAKLREHDAQKPVKIHDLNNPPRENYRHQKFPMMVYDHENSYPEHVEIQTLRAGGTLVEQEVNISAKIVSKLVHSEEQLQSAIEAGWKELPPEYREEESSFQTGATLYSGEAQRTQEQINALQPVKRKGGRPRKLVTQAV